MQCLTPGCPPGNARALRQLLAYWIHPLCDGGLLRSIDDTWKKLRVQIDTVVDGSAEEANVRRAVELQDQLVVDIQRISIAVTRFARIEQGGQGLPTPR